MWVVVMVRMTCLTLVRQQPSCKFTYVHALTSMSLRACVCSDPSSVKVPEEPDQRLTMALIRKVTAKAGEEQAR